MSIHTPLAQRVLKVMNPSFPVTSSASVPVLCLIGHELCPRRGMSAVMM